MTIPDIQQGLQTALLLHLRGAASDRRYPDQKHRAGQETPGVPK
jgi:hypothetical protein